MIGHRWDDKTHSFYALGRNAANGELTVGGGVKRQGTQREVLEST